MVEQSLPLPWWAWRCGLHRQAFHGLYCEYMTHALPECHDTLAGGRMIVAHLGGGASLCAMRGRKSVAATMGFSVLVGRMMGARMGRSIPVHCFTG